MMHFSLRQQGAGLTIFGTSMGTRQLLGTGGCSKRHQLGQPGDATGGLGKGKTSRKLAENLGSPQVSADTQFVSSFNLRK